MTITDAPVIHAPVRPAGRPIPQLSRRQIGAVWAAAALPMAAMSWIAAPILANHLDGPQAMPRALLVCLTVGLVWQGLLVAGLVFREQRTLRWSVVRETLWLRSPTSPRTGRVGGRVWWIVPGLVLALGVKELLPRLPHVASRDLGTFFQSDGAEQLFHGSWGWFGLLAVMSVFNTAVGEELLFRGYLLPRMNGAFGNRDWLANGVIFAGYHLHVPWVMPTVLVDTFLLAYPSKRYRSAWIGIAVHSAQTVFILLAALVLVL